MGMNIKAIESLLSRAKTNLRKELGKIFEKKSSCDEGIIRFYSTNTLKALK